MPKAKDLTGQKFNRLTALYRCGRDKYRNSLWFCLCDCGNTTTVRATPLIKGQVKSCGCFNSISKFKDITGQKFGKLTVISYSHINKSGSAVWLCQCDCGNKKKISGSQLRQGKVKSCGCLRHVSRKINLKGKKYYRLKVIKFSHIGKQGTAQWLCICECGNLKTVSGYKLTSGRTQSCGCFQKEQTRKAHTGEKHRLYKELKGMRFGRLTVLKRANRRKYQAIWWDCICDCGERVVARTASLTRGSTQSCGCLHDEMNRGENSHFWKGGISHEHSLFRNSSEYKSWRDDVFEKDLYICQKCGYDKSGNLNAHHIQPFATYPDKRIDIDNGLTLCEDCHVLFHKKYGVTNFTIENTTDFVST